MAHLQPTYQESERIAVGRTLAVTGWVLLFGVVLGIAAGLTLRARSRTLALAPASAELTARPVPEVHRVRSDLFSAPAASEMLRARQRHALTRYAWVDRQRELVQIPIELAIELEAAEAEAH